MFRRRRVMDPGLEAKAIRHLIIAGRENWFLTSKHPNSPTNKIYSHQHLTLRTPPRNWLAAHSPTNPRGRLRPHVPASGFGRPAVARAPGLAEFRQKSTDVATAAILEHLQQFGDGRAICTDGTQMLQQ
jgi:hypothetical protein